MGPIPQRCNVNAFFITQPCVFLFHSFIYLFIYFFCYLRYDAAVSNAGLVAISTPYIDAFGTGAVITASHTLYYGEASRQHTTKDKVIGVLGADFPLSYFQKWVEEHRCNSLKPSPFLQKLEIGMAERILNRGGGGAP